MKPVPQRIIVDDDNKPVAVQIAYEDWLRIEELLLAHDLPEPAATDLNVFVGSVPFSETGVEYQRRLRDEWT